MKHDRVMRFTPEFAAPQQAVRFAMQQAADWIGHTGAPSDTAALAEDAAS